MSVTTFPPLELSPFPGKICNRRMVELRKGQTSRKSEKKGADIKLEVEYVLPKHKQHFVNLRCLFLMTNSQMLSFPISITTFMLQYFFLKRNKTFYQFLFLFLF